MTSAFDSPVVGVHQITPPHGTLKILVQSDLCPTPVVVDESNSGRLGILRQAFLAVRYESVRVVQNDTVSYVGNVFLDVAWPLEFVTANEGSEQLVDSLQITVDLVFREVEEPAARAHPLLAIVLRAV